MLDGLHYCSPPHPFLRTAPALVALLLLLAATAKGQVSRFLFDANGNLLVQTAETSAPAQILGQPQRQVVAPGHTASFSVVAADTRNLTYQWRFNGVDITGATSDALFITNVAAVNEGLYSVVLLNSSGSVTSAPAMLWIDTDRDGLPDSWELTYFGNLSRYPTGDFDGDGVSNLDEFNDGTNPADAASVAYRLTVQNDGGMVTVAPAKQNYTNGEIVTLTASGFGDEVFRGWTGDVVSRSNQVTVTMNKSKNVVAHFQPFQITWIATSSGNWYNISNWSPFLIPTALDDVLISSGTTITIDQPTECHDLKFYGGTLTGSGSLTVYGAGEWGSGTLSGTGRTIIAPGATLKLSHSSSLVLDTRILENAGTVTWTGVGMTLVNATQITNRASGVFELQSAATFASSGVGVRSFENAGILRKSGTTGTFSFGTIPLNSYGSIDLQEGTLTSSSAMNSYGAITLSPAATLRYNGGGLVAGPLNIAATALVDWSAGTCALNAGAQLNGSGLFSISSGALTLNTDVTAERMNLGGILNGGGNLTISNSLVWNSGTLGGGGRAIIGPTATLFMTNNNTIVLDNRMLDIAGWALWNGSSSLMLVNAAGITNRPGGLFDIQGATQFTTSGPGTKTVENAGTLRKVLSTGTVSFATVPVNNYGTIEVQAGTLTSGSLMNSYGAITLSPGTTFRFSAGGVVAGPLNVPATALVDWASGTCALNPGGQLNGSGLFSISGGVLTLNTDATVERVNLASILNGGGNLIISNSLVWNTGTLGGGGRAIINPTATLSMTNNNTIVLDNRLLDIAGSAFLNGTASLMLANAGGITNRPGALFDIQGAIQFTTSGPGAKSVDNAGTLRKVLNSGTLSFGTALLNNYGTIEVQVGTLTSSSAINNYGSINLSPATTLRFNGGGVIAGPLNVPATALVDWSSGASSLNTGAQLNGSGQFRIGGAVTFNTNLTVQSLSLVGTLNGNGNVAVGSDMTWSSGTLGGSGRATILPGATLTFNQSANVALDTRKLENAGTVLWTGSGGMIWVGAAGITNRQGALFELRTSPSFSTSGGGGVPFDNAGILRKTLSTGTANFGLVPLNNYGTVDVRSGILLIANGYTSSAGATLNCTVGGTTAGSSYGQLQVNGAVTLNGALSIDLTNNFIPQTNYTFTVLTAGTRNSSFTGFLYPSNLVTMVMSNTSSTVLVQATAYSTSGPPVFVTDLPAAQLFYSGRVATQSVVVLGERPMTFQWKRNGTNVLNNYRIAGAQTGTLIITNAMGSDSDVYQLAVTNAQGFALSTQSVVRIQAVPRLNANGVGWTLQGTTAPPMSSNSVTLTSGLFNTGRSVFYNAPLYLSNFIASFIYRDVGGGGADGITFCLQNDPRGPSALGNGGGGIGYGGINPSVALVINIYSPNVPGIALRQNGSITTPYSSTAPVNPASGNPILVTIQYSNAVFKASLLDTTTSASFTTNYSLNLPALLGPTAYVGFTGGDGGAASTQVVSNFTYVPVTGISEETDPSGALGLYWPATIGGYTLETATNLLSGPGGWAPVPASVIQTNNRNQVIASPLTSRQFYRLSISPGE
jgi:hypothetical protein